jgi:hypothetical protein
LTGIMNRKAAWGMAALPSENVVTRADEVITQEVRVEPLAVGRHAAHFTAIQMDHRGDLPRVERLGLGCGPLREGQPELRDDWLHLSDCAPRSAVVGAAERLNANQA